MLAGRRWEANGITVNVYKDRRRGPSLFIPIKVALINNRALKQLLCCAVWLCANAALHEVKMQLDQTKSEQNVVFDKQRSGDI